MVRFVEVVDVPLPIEAAFDAVADFSTTVDWDPSVTRAVRTTSDPIRVGSRFRVDVDLVGLGRTQTYGYAITDYEPPSRVVLRGGDAGTRLTDEITFVARDGGTRITYEVRCELVGLGRLAEPLVGLALPLIGRRAADGLRAHGETLAARARRKAKSSARRRKARADADGQAGTRTETKPRTQSETKARTKAKNGKTTRARPASVVEAADAPQAEGAAS